MLRIRVIGWIFVAAGALHWAMWVPSGIRAYESLHWPTVVGRIEYSDVDFYFQRSAKIYFPKVTYRYDVAGASYTGRRIWAFNLNVVATATHAERISSRFPVGSSVFVSYDPSHPATAVLITGENSSAYWWLSEGTVAFVIGVILLRSTTRRDRYAGPPNNHIERHVSDKVPSSSVSARGAHVER